MWTIGIEVEFEAAHQLTKVPDGHKCRRLHGHNYVVIVECSANELDGRDFVLDYFDLKPIKTFINDYLDHRNLNEVLDFETTVENIAKFLYERFKPEFPTLSAITIKETPSTFCRYEQ